MQRPFLQHMNDFFARMRGRTLIAVGVIWGVLLILALLCVSGNIQLPGAVKTPGITEATPKPGNTSVQKTSTTDTLASPENTPEVTITGVVILPTPTSTPIEESTDETADRLPWAILVMVLLLTV